jgi:hypothetical protein
MSMDLDLKPGLFSRALDHPIEAIGREWRAALADENKRRFLSITF